MQELPHLCQRNRTRREWTHPNHKRLGAVVLQTGYWSHRRTVHGNRSHLYPLNVSDIGFWYSGCIHPDAAFVWECRVLFFWDALLCE